MEEETPILRALVDTRERQVQKARIQFENRIGALERRDDEGTTAQLAIVERYYRAFLALEKELEKDIADIVSDYPIFDYVSEVRGIGPGLAAKLIAMIDIDRAPHVSSLWRYAGFGLVKDDEGNLVRERPVKGQKLSYNKRLKTSCRLIAMSFLKTGSPYRAVYDQAKEFYTLNRPDWTKAHCHEAALRKMVKLFLSHLWVVWRTLERLPVTEPYAHARLGHSHYYTPQEFGWPDF